MPRFARIAGLVRFRPVGRGRPDQGLPGEEEDHTPDWGIPEGELPEVEPPDPPIGIWPPLTPEQPWRPIPSWPERPSTGPVPTPPQPPAGGIGGRPPDRPGPGPGDGEAGHLPVLPPGMIWPPLPPDVHGKYLALVLVAGMPGVKYRYVVVDADARPQPPAGGIGGRPPARPEPEGR
jgi:hypothetical protein